MQNNWYNTESQYTSAGDWYSPAPAPVSAAAEEKKPDKRKKRRSRIFALIICLFVIGAAAAVIFGSRGDSEADSSSDILPDDWHDYLESYYAATEAEPADIDIPQVEATGGLTLNFTGTDGKAALSLQQVYSKCAPSIVSIRAITKDGSSWGTGVVFTSDGYIVTNTHVIDGSSSVSIGLSNGSWYEASLVGADVISDISVLKIDASGLTAAEFADSASIRVGDSVSAIGNPLGETYKLTMTNGIISAVSRDISYNGYTLNLLQTNTALNEGNSGGALINEYGQVVGITNMKIMSSSASVEGMGFAIPSATVKSIVDGLLADGAIYGRCTIGITIGPVPTEAADYYDIPQGLYVSVVMKKSDAAAQGMKAGDIITHVNGQEVHTTSDVAEIKETLSIGDSMSFTVWRDGKSLDITVKLMDATELYR